LNGIWPRVSSSSELKNRPRAGRAQSKGRKFEVTPPALICSACFSPGGVLFVTQMPLTSAANAIHGLYQASALRFRLNGK
jgi:hypothetical protein